MDLIRAIQLLKILDSNKEKARLKREALKKINRADDDVKFTRLDVVDMDTLISSLEHRV
jgi:hypothetical protein